MRPLLLLIVLIPSLALAQDRPVHDRETTIAMYQDIQACLGFFASAPQQRELHNQLGWRFFFWKDQVLFYQPDWRDVPRRSFATREEIEQALSGQNNELYSWAVTYCNDLVHYTDQYR